MRKLTFEDALKIARGCTDYGGGYRGNQEHFEIYQHGIQTVINALTGAANSGLEDMQVAALHRMGANTAPEVEPTVKPRSGLYLCIRTSAYGEKPCDEAFRVLLTVTDTRNCDDPKKIPAHRGTDGDWYTKGTNHRVESGMIRRDMGTEERWAVELADIAAFTAFLDKYGKCVVGRNTDGFSIIEIYDDYRE